jgi:hypothetical protein
MRRFVRKGASVPAVLLALGLAVALAGGIRLSPSLEEIELDESGTTPVLWGVGDTDADNTHELLRSTDGGASFSEVTLPTSDQSLRAVGLAGDTVLVVGEQGVVYRSADSGTNFTEVSVDASAFDATGGFRVVERGPPLDPQDPSAGHEWMAGGTSEGAPILFRSTDDGLTWTRVTGLPSGFAGTVRGIAWDGRWVVVGGDAAFGDAFALTSPDGLAWTQVTLPTNTPTLAGVSPDGQGGFVAVGESSTVLTLAGPDYATASLLYQADLTEGWDLQAVAQTDGGEIVTAGQEGYEVSFSPGDAAPEEQAAVTGSGTVTSIATGASGTYLAGPDLSGSPVPSVPDATVEFGEVVVGESGSATVAVTNAGDENLEVTGVSGSGVFRLSASVTIAAGQSDDLILVFEPTTTGIVQTDLELLTNSPLPSSVSVAGNGVPTIAFPAYLDRYGVPSGESAYGDDPDGDGAINLLEYAMASDPNSAASLPASVVGIFPDSGKSYPGLSFLRLRGGTENGAAYTVEGVVVTVQGATDLQSWTEPVIRWTPVPEDLPAAPAGYEWISYRLQNHDLDQGHGFLRLQVAEETTP